MVQLLNPRTNGGKNDKRDLGQLRTAGGRGSRGKRGRTIRGVKADSSPGLCKAGKDRGKFVRVGKKKKTLTKGGDGTRSVERPPILICQTVGGASLRLKI